MVSRLRAGEFPFEDEPAEGRSRSLGASLNYGFDRVRFLAPVPAGTAVRLQVELTEVTPKANGSLLVRCRNTAHNVVDPSQPLMVADSLAVVVAA